MSRTELGFFGQQLAIEFLEKRGYILLDENYLKPWGEIDVICSKNNVIVFVEVKTNKKEMPGFEPESRVNRDKLARMIRAARTYLLYRKYSDSQEWRIDVMSVTVIKERGVAKIRHFINIDAI